MTWQDKFQNGLAYQHAGRLDAAERSYRATISANPGFAAAHHNLGTVLHLRGRYLQAIHAFEASAKLDPDLTAAARLGVGVILTRTGDFAGAEAALRAAIATAPASPDPYRFLGDLFRATGRMEDARAAFQGALKCSPEDPEARFGLASVRLALGEMPEGWDDYEYRRSKLASAALQPVWSGEDIVGRTLLIHSEQGLGDAIQFLRYVPLLAARRATVLLAVRQEIMALAATVEGAARVVEPSYTLPGFDCSCALPSLPRMFHTTLATIPGNAPYVQAHPARIEAWREKLGETDGTTVAIAWRGNPTHRNDHRRSILDGEIAPLFKLPGVRFLVIQKDDGDAPDVDNVLRLGAHDLSDIAAVMSLADLTISVDTVFCHLAGALGRPVWTMLSVAPDWRWRLEGETTPWYPTMRLFRQNTPGDWNGVVRDVMGALAEVPRRQA
jgi:tetratricopeptide (TPR) repeat protein